MPIVKIDMWEGRTDEQKAKMITAVTKAVCDSVNCPPGSVQIMIQDYKKSDWGIAGKQASVS
jgi:4-oxalocrotonate tautomerase